ncbi:hypothetical protein M569_10737, partial [Genlisea aurea]
MAEEASDFAVKVSAADGNGNSVEAAMHSGIDGGNSVSADGKTFPESSVENCSGDREKSLEYADELMAAASKAAEDRDYAEASDCYSRALEIRVAHFGELSHHCANAYYKYGCVLLYKAQEEADPLVSMPKKDGVSQEDSTTAVVTGESSAGFGSEKGSSSKAAGCKNNYPFPAEVNAEEGEGESDDDEVAEGEEDESDLDLAWKMLDVARAIVEKHSGDTMVKVDILSALAEVSLEREDVETSVADYLKALSILERLVEPDSRHLAEINFRLCLCLEIGNRPEEAIPYCQKAISVCKSRVASLTEQVRKSCVEISDEKTPKFAAEIETLDGLCGELEKKLEDLEQLVSNPKSILSDIMGLMSAKAKEVERNAVSLSAAAATDSSRIAGPSESSASSSAVTHLGVVGRGVKRIGVVPNADAGPSKRTAAEPSA